VPRKEQEKISMSESCFSHEKVDMIKRKAKGTLMHNINNRMACTNTLERTLRESKYQHADFLDPKSTIEIKSFHHDTNRTLSNGFDR